MIEMIISMLQCYLENEIPHSNAYKSFLHGTEVAVLGVLVVKTITEAATIVTSNSYTSIPPTLMYAQAISWKLVKRGV